MSAVVAVVVAATSAIVASRWFPVGLGRRIDPDVGFHVDWVVLGPGLVLTLLLVLGGTLLVAARAGTARVADAHHRASLFATRMRRRAPLTVGLGATMAFDRGRGRTSIPVLPALVGAVVGVLGVVGALTISSGLHDALAHGERAGVTWDLTVEPPPDGYTTTGDVKPAIATTIRNSGGGTLALINRQLVPVNGIGSPAFSIGATDGSSEPIEFGLLSGRAPRTADEVAIGPATARDLHVKVGDTVHLGDSRVPAAIVGEALFPSDVHSEFDEGIWLTPDRLDQLVPLDPTMHGRAIAVRFPAGADKAKVQAALQSALPAGTNGTPADLPVEVANLRNVRTLPLLLAGFLALLRVGALSHVLLTSARRRRRDFAILPRPRPRPSPNPTDLELTSHRHWRGGSCGWCARRRGARPRALAARHRPSAAHQRRTVRGHRRGADRAHHHPGRQRTGAVAGAERGQGAPGRDPARRVGPYK